MKAKYDSKENCLQEQPDRPKPLYYDAYLACRSANRYLALTLEDLNTIIEYEDHLKSLRTLPCSPEAVNVFKHGELYELDKDFKLGLDNCSDHYTLAQSMDCPDCKVVAVPLDPPKGEDEDTLWLEVKEIFMDSYVRAEFPYQAIDRLKTRFSITKKQ